MKNQPLEPENGQISSVFGRLNTPKTPRNVDHRDSGLVVHVVDCQEKCVVANDSIRLREKSGSEKCGQNHQIKPILVNKVDENEVIPTKVPIDGIDGVDVSGKQDLDSSQPLCVSGEELDGFGPEKQANDNPKPPLKCEGNIGSFSDFSTPQPKKS